MKIALLQEDLSDGHRPPNRSTISLLDSPLFI